MNVRLLTSLGLLVAVEVVVSEARAWLLGAVYFVVQLWHHDTSDAFYEGAVSYSLFVIRVKRRAYVLIAIFSRPWSKDALVSMSLRGEVVVEGNILDNWKSSFYPHSISAIDEI
jgi:hypothetical protein